MYTRRVRLLWSLLVFSDLIVLALAFEFAYLIRTHLPQLRFFFFTPGTSTGILLISALLWAWLDVMLKAYRDAAGFATGKMLRLTITQTFWFVMALATAIYLLKMGEISRSFIGLFVAINFIAQTAFRLAGRRMRTFLQREFAGHRCYVIVGTGTKAMEVTRLIEKNEEHGDKVNGFVREEDGPEPDQSGLKRRYPVWEFPDLLPMLREHVVDEVIFVVSKTQLEKMEDLLLSCEEQGVKTRVLVDFFPHLRSDISFDKLEQFPLLTFSRTPENEYLLFFKRAMDLVLSGVMLVIGAPLLAMIALLVKISSQGPVIYRQMRCGLNGRKFWLYKFRSMQADAEQRKEEVAHLNEMDGPVFKIARDPRATAMGRFLRKTSLDELPQLVNILKGDMSFVGPRPPLPEEVAQYEQWQRRRLRMKPGLTCLWALEGRNELNFARWMKLDMEYIDNWSLALDLKILLRTIPRVLSGRGAS
ncbi:MAG: hypothetical protein A3F68_00995 [Acidobacteria bacterium RIFCSPLOWO2_12_FULL_54_10]|nr:MAG: hypothetical protein A3F68_00995 [Acidobacteria bacterium RIFCSPLOWO2_12_FULL_54_10]